MTTDGLPSIPTFDEQLRALIEIGFLPKDLERSRLWYEDSLRSKLTEIEDGDFSLGVVANIAAWSTEYSTRFGLLTSPLTELRYFLKSFKSVVNKVYRRIILNSGNVAGGFTECIFAFDDLVRQTLVCRFGDGPEFLATKFEQLAHGLGLTPQISKRADDYGYYAVHFTFKTDVQLIALDTRDVLNVQLTTEIQLTTRLQESLRDLTHELYEARRLNPGTGGEWKWNFDSPFFKPSYTGHSLHLLEGLLLEMKKESERRTHD